MKNLIVFLFIITSKLIIAQTPANVGGVETPTIITEEFTKHHPTLVPNWSREGQNYKAIYEDPATAKAVMIVYDKKGEVVHTESELDNMNSPKSVNEYYTKNYPDEKNYKVFNTQDKTGVNGYYINRENNEMIWFDKDGNYVRKNPK